MRILHDGNTQSRWSLTTTVVLVALWLAGAEGLGQTMDALLEGITSADVRTRSEAAARLGKLGAEAIQPLAKVLGSENPAVVEAARTALHDISHRAARPGAEEERARAAKALATACSGARSDVAKNALLEILSTVGGAESVPAIAAALRDPETHEMACFALVRIPVPAAAQALRNAMEKGRDLPPSIQIALLNALGARWDAAAAPLLADVAENASSNEVRLAALEALSRDTLAYAYNHVFWSALRAAAPNSGERSLAWDSLLRVGQAFIDAFEVGAASDHYCDLLEAAASTAEKCSAIIGLGRAGRRRAPDLVFEALADEELQVRAAARAALQGMRGLVVPRISQLLEAAEPSLKVDLLEVLAKRKEPEAGVVAASLLGDDEPKVRRAALKAVEARPSPEAGLALIKAIEEKSPVTREGAVGVLGRMPGEDVAKAIIEKAKAAKPDLRARLLEVISMRAEEQAEELLLASVHSDDAEAVRIAAYRALGNLGKIEVLPALLAGLDRGGPDASAAEQAIGKLPLPQATPVLMDATSARSGASKAALLRVLGKHREPRIVDLLLGASKSGDASVRLAALRGLCAQEDPRVIPVLLEAAVAGPEEIRSAAVVGCLRFGRALEQQAPDRALAIYHKALAIEAAGGVDERREAIAGIGRLADRRSVPVLKPFLDDKTLRHPAAAAVLRVAVKLGPHGKREAVELLKKAIPIAPGAPGVQDAVAMLEALGVQYDIARDAGFITHWWLVGPLPNPRNELFSQDLLDPENVQAADGPSVKVGDQTLRWKQYQSRNPQGIVDLLASVAPREWVGAYAYTEINVPDGKRVTFNFGSDDSLVCWLNGKKIHAFGGVRGTEVDQDKVDTKLVPGKNRILLKVLNQGGGWGFCLRITDRTGAPLVLDVREY